MKYWKYQIVNRANVGTEENPVWNESLFGKMLPQTEANEKIAKAEAYNGIYEPYDDGKPNHPIASHNIISGEYVTIGNVLYLATENIPNGEPIIVGQNAVETTVEEQLSELMKGE